MNCPKCNTPNMDDSIFCSGCGASLNAVEANRDFTESEMDKTMSIPVVRGGMEETTTIPVVKEREHPKPAAPRPKQNYVRMPAPQPKPVKKNSKEKILVFVIAFLVTLILGLCIALAVILLGGNKEPQVDDSVVYTDSTPSQTDSDTDENVEEDMEKPEEGESVGVEDEESVGIKIDKGFGFATGVAIESTAIEYKTLSGSEYVCDIPSVFRFVSDNGEEIRYAPEDKTAYMDIATLKNTMSLSELMDKTASEIGGSVKHKERGEDYFVMSIESNGVIYYQKCYVGDYITYLEVVYPAEYDDVYSVYIADMEKSFEKK